MAENKTRPTSQSPEAFIDGLDIPRRQEEARLLLGMMREITGLEPEMWGPTIVGFGRYHYRYESGREGDFFRLGFSPRKAALTVYVVPGFEPFGELMAALGKHRTGSSCLYLNKLGDVDLDVLRELMQRAFALMNERYPA